MSVQTCTALWTILQGRVQKEPGELYFLSAPGVFGQYHGSEISAENIQKHMSGVNINFHTYFMV